MGATGVLVRSPQDAGERKGRSFGVADAEAAGETRAGKVGDGIMSCEPMFLSVHCSALALAEPWAGKAPHQGGMDSYVTGQVNLASS